MPPCGFIQTIIVQKGVLESPFRPLPFLRFALKLQETSGPCKCVCPFQVFRRPCIWEVSNGGSADGVGVTFPIFSANRSCLLLYKGKNNEEKHTKTKKNKKESDKKKWENSLNDRSPSFLHTPRLARGVSQASRPEKKVLKRILVSGSLSGCPDLREAFSRLGQSIGPETLKDSSSWAGGSQLLDGQRGEV